MYKKDPSSLTATHTVVAHEKYVNAVTISPNDRIVATASAFILYLYFTFSALE